MRGVSCICNLLIGGCNLWLFGCANYQTADLNSVLWMQSSVEYRATTIQAFALARQMLDAGLRDESWTAAPMEQDADDIAGLKWAVILDIDETVLDNSPHQAWLIKEGHGYKREKWNRWCQDASAPGVAGAVEFARYAKSLKVTVYYVSNRDHEVEARTRDNLAALGFPIDDDVDTVLTRNERPDWGSKKGTRRQAIADAGYRIILLIGDNLGDFLDDYKDTPEKRLELLQAHYDKWGTKWIVIPNPSYGSWQASLYNFEYYRSAREKHRHKRSALDPWEPSDE